MGSIFPLLCPPFVCDAVPIHRRFYVRWSPQLAICKMNHGPVRPSEPVRPTPTHEKRPPKHTQPGTVSSENESYFHPNGNLRGRGLMMVVFMGGQDQEIQQNKQYMLRTTRLTLYSVVERRAHFLVCQPFGRSVGASNGWLAGCCR